MAQKIADIAQGFYVKGRFVRCIEDIGCGMNCIVPAPNGACMHCGLKYKDLEVKMVKFIASEIARESQEIADTASKSSSSSTGSYKAVGVDPSNTNPSIKLVFEIEVYNTYINDEQEFKDAESDIGVFLNNELFHNYEHLYMSFDPNSRERRNLNQIIKALDGNAQEMVKKFKEVFSPSFDRTTLK